MAQVVFYTCTQTAYNAATKNEGSLYFTTDTKRLYKGDTLYGGSFEYVNSLEGLSGNTETLYYEASTGFIKIWDGTNFVTKFLPFSTAITSSSTDATVPTSKAVYDVVSTEAATRSGADSYLSGAIDTLNGSVETAGSVAKSIKDAKDELSGLIGPDFTTSSTVKDYVDAEATARAANDGVLSGAIDLINGSDSTVGSFKYGDATISGAIGGSFSSEHTVADAIAELDSAAISVSGAANNAIEVTTSGEGGVNKTVGLKINSNDKFLSQTSDGLSATFSLKKVTTGLGETVAAEYYIEDKDGNQVGDRISIAKDQFLKSAEFEQGSGSADDKIKLVFNTSSGVEDTVYIPLSGLFDEYTAGGGVDIQATAAGFEISGVVDGNSESFLTVGADGFKLSGVQTAINTGDEAISGAIGGTFAADGTTVKSYIDNIKTTLSGQIGEGFGSGTTSGTVAEYINTRVDDLASSTTTALGGKLGDVDTNKAGEIIIAKADGKVETSGKEVGGATISANPTANTVATEAAVSAFVDTKINDAITGALVWNTL